MTETSEEWFGDLTVDDAHAEIEAWEEADEVLATGGMSLEDRRKLWRSLDPDGAVLDWYDELRRQGHDDELARQIIREVGAMK